LKEEFIFIERNALIAFIVVDLILNPSAVSYCTFASVIQN